MEVPLASGSCQKDGHVPIWYERVKYMCWRGVVCGSALEVEQRWVLDRERDAGGWRFCS